MVIENEQSISDHENPLDVLIIKIIGINDGENGNSYEVNVSFYNYDKIINSVRIKAVTEYSKIEHPTEIMGTLDFDPSDYEQMSLFADYPIIVTARPTKSDLDFFKSIETISGINNQKKLSSLKQIDTLVNDTYSCNIDIVSLFMDQKRLYLKKHMEPMVEPTILKKISWDNLPILTIELSINKNPLNKFHHDVFKSANYLKLTVGGLYNVKIPSLPNIQFSISTQMPVNNEENCSVFKFGNGYTPKTTPNVCFPGWESLRFSGEYFTKADDKLDFESYNSNIKIIDYEKAIRQKENCVLWNTFHRTLMFGKTKDWFSNRIREKKWPLEINVSWDTSEKSFFFLIDLFPLLYPGESNLTVALPFQSLIRSSQEFDELQRKLGGSISKQPSLVKTSQKNIRSVHSLKSHDSTIDSIDFNGADGNEIFVLINIKLYKPLQDISLPPFISESEINKMLCEFENESRPKRVCTGRVIDKKWRKTVELAAASLHRVTYYGTSDLLCSFQRQLAETRQHVEIVSSFCEEAAKYVNDNFIVNQHTKTAKAYEEFLLSAHLCLMKEVENTLLIIPEDKINPVLRAARHSRQLQDVKHARRLYFQILTEHPNDGNIWRELSTCLKDMDLDSAYVCMLKALELDSRHPLNLLSMGCLVLDKDAGEAEPFFEALMYLYPFHATLWYIAHCYYIKCGMFTVADKIIELILLNKTQNLCQELTFGRKWEDELGDWWDPTPTQIGMNSLYDATDLLLRIRGLTLADIGVAQALKINGENVAYYHLLALCCRLRGEFAKAHCHLQRAKEKYGEITYLMTLEAECLVKLGDFRDSMILFDKAGFITGPYSILVASQSRKYPKSRSVLLDLVETYPSAYAWMALANDFMQYPEKNFENEWKKNKMNITACAKQALKIDRGFARAWLLLSNHTHKSDRRKFFEEMAAINGIHDHEKHSRHKTLNYCYKTCILRHKCQCHLPIN